MECDVAGEECRAQPVAAGLIFVMKLPEQAIMFSGKCRRADVAREDGRINIAVIRRFSKFDVEIARVQVDVFVTRDAGERDIACAAADAQIHRAGYLDANREAAAVIAPTYAEMVCCERNVCISRIMAATNRARHPQRLAIGASNRDVPRSQSHREIGARSDSGLERICARARILGVAECGQDPKPADQGSFHNG